MACSNEIMVQENDLVKAIQAASEFRLNGDELDIIYDGAKFIRLKRKKGATN